MNRAAHGLQQGRAEQAIGAEQDALSQLRLCKRSLEGALKGMEGKGAMGQSGAAMASQSTPWSRVESFRGDARGHEVEIPDPEDFVSPEAFRALLQEGASEEAPRRYKPLNRSYYEELVR